MTEPNNRELNDKIADIREWLVRIDTKVDYLNEVRSTAERAEQKAEKALMKTDDIDKNIDQIRTTTKWAIGLTITSILSIGGLIVTIAF
ncbi:hemolysin XhlA family protein [Fictibacillus sp. Mic-4]|uniref:hemolysin XhlA family protein n=1 Tax=Fictibacillus sp. Mic-4 TaxID=3132826 RepID=UPI003CF6EB2A